MRIGGGAVSIADVTNRAARDLGFVRPFWYEEIRAGRAFHRGVSLVASVGDYSEIQLFNEVGSGITVLVRRILYTTQTGPAVHIRAHNTALATDVGAGFNMAEGGTAAAAHIRTSQPNALDGTLIATLRIPVDTLLPLVGEWFKELDAGEGIQINPNVVNIEAQAYFEWIEL